MNERRSEIEQAWFEAEFEKSSGYPASPHPYEDGYDSPYANGAWLGWQLARGKGEVVVTTDKFGECIAVTRQDEEGRILSIIWSKLSENNNE